MWEKGWHRWVIASLLTFITPQHINSMQWVHWFPPHEQKVRCGFRVTATRWRENSFESIWLSCIYWIAADNFPKQCFGCLNMLSLLFRWCLVYICDTLCQVSWFLIVFWCKQLQWWTELLNCVVRIWWECDVNFVKSSALRTQMIVFRYQLIY